MSHSNRRRFLIASGSLLAASLLRGADVPAASDRFRCAVIGHTGRGDYGHGMDVIFNDRDDCEVVAVADPDEQGRAKAAARCHAARSYADFREMLAKER